MAVMRVTDRRKPNPPPSNDHRRQLAACGGKTHLVLLGGQHPSQSLVDSSAIISQKYLLHNKLLFMASVNCAKASNGGGYVESLGFRGPGKPEKAILAYWLGWPE
jgi:hypothetical protein